MDQKKKKTSVRFHVNIGYLVCIASIVIFAICFVLFVMSLTVWQAWSDWQELEYELPIIFGSILLASFIGALFVAILFTERNYRFYKKFYKNNIKNLQALRDKSINLSLDDESVKEIEDANKIFSDIRKQNKGHVISTKNFSYSNLDLEYLDKDKVVVTYKSLKENLLALLTLSDSFRNGLIEIYYDTTDGLNNIEFSKIAEIIKKSLVYKNLLISRNAEKNGVLIYVPAFDSVSQIEEELVNIQKRISIVRSTSDGRVIVAGKIAMVIHPYSAPNNMFLDLELAKHEEKVLNIYMPNKANAVNTSMLYESFNSSQLGKASERLDALDLSNPDFQKEIMRILSDLCNYFSFDNVGFVKYNRVMNEFICQYSYSPIERELISQKSTLSNKFVSDLLSCKDNDNSYYFSNRKHVNDLIAPFIDAHEIKSGMFYIAMKNGSPSFVIYFVNFSKGLAFDNSVREGLINIANKIGVYLRSYEDSFIAKINDLRFKDVLKLHNTLLYSINPDDYKLFFVSDALKAYCPEAIVGEKCYKVFYNREAPCKNCPLKGKKHMVDSIKERLFESKVVLHNSNDTAKHILLTPKTADKDTSELFSPDFLINSYYSFNRFISDEYALGNEGELIFFSVDNVSSIIENFGSDGFISLMRSAFDALNAQLGVDHSLFVVSNELFALSLPRVERSKAVIIIEKMHSFIKSLIYANKMVKMEASYYVFKYPISDTNEKEYIKHVKEVINGFKTSKKTDFMYFDEDGYIRNASREIFMFENVLEAFNKKKYYLQYQPVVGNKDRLIHAAEVLLRVKDPFTDELMNIGEVISILEKHSRLELISQALNNCIGDLFAKSDVPFFTSLGIQYLSLNFDYLTLADAEFSANFRKFIKDNNIPKDFLHFEIPEKDIGEHLEGFKSLKWDSIMLVCDQYTGKYVSLKRLKELGFMRAKISREVTLNVANDDAILEKALNIWKKAQSLNIPVTFVGIEKRQQTDLLHDDYLDSGFQGRFFFPPLDEEHFYQVLRENSIKEIADLEN